MYFNYHGFLKALNLSMLRKPFRLRRWLFVLLFTCVYLFFVGLMAFGRCLDHVFFPGFRKVAIDKPVFIIAPPRSGTTLLQRLLSLDEERFVSWKMYQTIFPSICLQKVCDVLTWLDGRLAGAFRRIIGWCERKWFGGWDDMHRMRLNQPEEDQALFVYAFASEAIFMLFPFVNELWELGFPDALPAESRRRLMAYYRGYQQRHVYANGRGRTLLVKSTYASGCIESLSQEFPDARFITIVRHPYEAIASHVSLFVPVWQVHSPEISRDGPESRAYATLAVEWYKHLFRFRERTQPENYFCIDYRELKTDPAIAVTKLYAHFGWDLQKTYSEKLSGVTDRQRQFESAHRYLLEDFGLSKAWIQTQLGAVFTAYNLPR